MADDKRKYVMLVKGEPAPPNTYDKDDMVKRESVIIAGPMKCAVYRVRDPETLKWSGPQFHFTYDNIVLAVMGPEAAKLFARFVDGYFSGIPMFANPDIEFDGQGVA